jgi:hypothetical protein
MNYTTRRKRSNKKSSKTRKHRGGINWKFWQTAPANAPAPAATPAPAPAAEVVENKCPPCPVCAQAQLAQAQAQQAPIEPIPTAMPALEDEPTGSMMTGGKRRRGRKSNKKSNRKSKKWFQMGCKSMF